MRIRATHACAACGIRFPLQERRPSCGGKRTFDLGDEVSFVAFSRARNALIKPRTKGFALLEALAPWKPTSRGYGIVAAAFVTLPIGFALHGGLNSFRDTWIDKVTFRTYHEGLSTTGLEVIAIGLVGLAFFAFWAVTSFAASKVVHLPKAVGIHCPPEDPGADSIVGRVTSEDSSVSPVDGRSCVLFGISGTIGPYPFDDGDGADFEIEVDGSGERVDVSIDNAVIHGGSDASVEVVTSDDLRAFAEARGISLPTFFGGDRVSVLSIRQGDRVRIYGEIASQKKAVYRDHGAEKRVVAASAMQPVVVGRLT